MTDLIPTRNIIKTKRYSIIDYKNNSNVLHYNIYLDINCDYTNDIIKQALLRRTWCTIITNNNTDYNNDINNADSNVHNIQICDFENIIWDKVLNNNNSSSSSYLIRKGLSRKAQLSLQLKRYLSKNNNNILKNCIPETYIIETWNAFEEMNIDIGGGILISFQDNNNIMKTSLKQKLDWCLIDIKEIMNKNKNKLWILKSSVTNKGYNIIIIKNYNDLIITLENIIDIREWVLQEYIDNPLLIMKKSYKFHLRVYILCIGALNVLMFDKILILCAAHKYDKDNTNDVYAHLTNTARASEDTDFNEEKFVKLLDDLPYILLKEYSHKYKTINETKAIVTNIITNIKIIINNIFTAYENEYSIFCPMANCFEIYGLDFMLDEYMNIWFLEINPGPDFKQTGNRLKGVITQLWEQLLRIVIDTNILHKNNNNNDINLNITKNFNLVYSKEWSTAKHNHGMKFE